MAEPVIVDLLRHGEVAGPGAVARGCGTDVCLTDKGWQQMRAVGSRLSEAHALTHIASSPLHRCADFAAALSGELAVPLAYLDAMRELDFGHWEGKQGHEIAEQALLTRFMDNPQGVQIPGGESLEDLQARVVQAWQAWLRDASGEHRLLVAHGLVIRVLLAHLLGLPLAMIWRLALPYGSWSRVSLLQGEQPRLLFLNREVGDD